MVSEDGNRADIAQTAKTGVQQQEKCALRRRSATSIENVGIGCERLDGVFCSEDLLALLKQFLARPMSCNMKMNVSCGPHDARTDFEQTNANRIRTSLR